MSLSTEQLTLIEARVGNDGPSTGTAYLLWFFLGVFAAHRFYLGRPGSAVVMILAWCCFIFPGAIWWLIDGFALPGMIRANNARLRKQMATSMLREEQRQQQAAAPATA